MEKAGWTKKLEFSLDVEKVAKALGVVEDVQEEFEEIFEECMKTACPKAACAMLPVTHLEDGRIAIGDETFDSKVMQVNFKDLHRTFGYVCTCGRELHDLMLSKEDVLEQYWVDAISEMVLMDASRRFHQGVCDQYDVKTLYSMNPGSLQDFPIQEQRKLFRLLAAETSEIGVELKESCLMIPKKSSSGFYFESEAHYTNCSLCPRLECPNRREPYNPDMMQSRFGIQAE